MSIIRRMRKQDAVYWEKTGTNARGVDTFATPIAVKVRWEDVYKEFVDAGGEVRISKSEVFVDRDMPFDSILWLGTLASLTDPQKAAPMAIPGARPIKGWSKIPTLRATEFLRTAILS